MIGDLLDLPRIEAFALEQADFNPQNLTAISKYDQQTDVCDFPIVKVPATSKEMRLDIYYSTLANLVANQEASS